MSQVFRYDVVRICWAHGIEWVMALFSPAIVEAAGLYDESRVSLKLGQITRSTIWTLTSTTAVIKKVWPCNDLIPYPLRMSVWPMLGCGYSYYQAWKCTNCSLEVIWLICQWLRRSTWNLDGWLMQQVITMDVLQWLVTIANGQYRYFLIGNTWGWRMISCDIIESCCLWSVTTTRPWWSRCDEGFWYPLPRKWVVSQWRPTCNQQELRFDRLMAMSLQGLWV